MASPTFDLDTHVTDGHRNILIADPNTTSDSYYMYAYLFADQAFSDFVEASTDAD